MIKNVLLVGMGGFLGSVARYFVSMLNLSLTFMSVPFGTLLVNVSGSFIIGFLAGLADKSTILTTELRMFLMVGICGGFTTFSSFTSENLTLIHNGQVVSVLLYTCLSIILGFVAVYLGYVTTNLL